MFKGPPFANKRKYEHVTPILRSLNWLPVRDQLYFRDAVLAFKCMSGLAPGYLSDKLITRSTVSKRELDTKNSQMLNIPLFRTAIICMCFYFILFFVIGTGKTCTGPQMIPARK